MKTMEINELISKLKEYDGELTVKVWSGGAEKPYPISNVAAGTMCAYIGVDDRNLVDLSKIWHDASEEPQYKNKRILSYSEHFDNFFMEYPNYLMVKDGGQNKNWETAVLRNKISKWVYESDLLPKGGAK